MPLPVTQLTAAAMVAVSIVTYLSPSMLSYLALIPANTLTVHAYVWNVLTSGLVAANPVTALLSAGVLVYGAKAERQWGDIEMGKFLTATTAATSVAVFITTFVALVSGTEGLFYMHYCGDIGVACAVLVAMKQQCPDNEIIPGVPIRVKWLPLAAVSLSLILELFFPTHIAIDSELGEGRATLRGSHLLHTTFGSFFAWIYLRFFQPNATYTARYGDVSPSFAFKTFFPDVIQPLVGAIADAVFTICNTLCCGFGASLIEAESEMLRRQQEDQVSIFQYSYLR